MHMAYRAQALIIANERTSTYENVLEKTKGVLFLGTPHRGSDIAYWTGFAARILRATQLGTGTNSDLLALLERTSKTLADISQQFVHRSSGLQICTFYETEKLSYINDLIVDKDSALLGLPNERQFPIAANHRTMCKFVDKESQKYNPVWKSINQMVTSFTAPLTEPKGKTTEDENYQKCLTALFLTEPEDDYGSVRHSKGSRLEGTCEWIQDVEEFSDWLKSPGWQVLLVVGEPGIGKTMIATYVIDDLQKRSEQRNDVIFAYYFCDNKDERRRSVQAMLRSFLLQILRQRPEFFPHIASDFKTQGAQLFSSSNSLHALWRITMSIFRSPTPGTIIFVIDAYDECEEESRGAFLDMLLQSFTDNTGSRNVKIFLTSRRTREISHITPVEKPFLKVLKVDNGRVNLDLAKFIDERVRSLAKYRYSPERRRSIAKKLKSRALGTFLWVSLILVELSKTLPSLSDKTLDQMPEGLVELYDRILHQIKPEHLDIVKNILLWVVTAFRPLNIAELETATSISRGLRPKGPIPQSPTHSAEEDLSDEKSTVSEGYESDNSEFRAELELCPLIRYDGGTVYLIHQSVKDYLTSKGISINVLPREDVAHFAVFGFCTEYLSFEAFADVIELPEHQSQDPLAMFDFLEYACKYWGEHARQSQTAPVDNTEWTREVFILNDMKRQTFYDVIYRLEKSSEFRQLFLPSHINIWRHVGYAIERFNHSVTTLHVLVYLNLPCLIDVLLSSAELKQILNHVECRGKTALHMAVELGHIDLVHLLISKGSSVNTQDDKGSTPLFEACLRKDYHLAKLLMENGSDVHKGKNEIYDNLLSAAIRRDSFPITDLLLQNGCDPKSTDDGLDALTIAIISGNIQLVAILLNHGAKIFAIHITYCEHDGILELLFERLKADWAVCGFHEAAITQAVFLENKSLLDHVLQNMSRHGCQNATDHVNATLNRAARRADASMIEFLLTELRDGRGGISSLEHLSVDATAFDAFHDTEYWGGPDREEIFDLLAKHGVDVNFHDEQGETAFHRAIRGQLE